MEKEKASLFYKFVFAIMWLIFKTFFRLSIKGEKVPRTGAAIVAANHRSYLDPIVMNLSCGRLVSFLGKEELFDIPVLSWIVRKFSTVPVKRGKADVKSLKKIIEMLREGKLIGIFPEGTRRRHTENGETTIFRGVGLLSEKTGAPVYPLSITGTDKIFVGGIIPIRLPKITVVVGKAIEPESGLGKELQVSISSKTMETIERNLK